MNDSLERSTHGMTEPSAPTPYEPGPESPSLAPEDRALDAMLRAYAQRHEPPAALSRRVYEASVGSLPGRHVRRAAAPPRPLASSSLWGRLAMAASIGLVFYVAVRILPRTVVSPPLPVEAELALTDFASEGVLGDDSIFADIDHLLVTRDMTFNDLTSDLANLADDLEM